MCERASMKQHMAVISALPLAPDSLADMKKIWGTDVALNFFSVLPENTFESIQRYLAGEGEKVLMLGLDCNIPTAISIDALTPKIEEILASLPGHTDFALFACAGDFFKLESPLLTIQPNILLRNMLKSILQPHMRLGVITPGEKQISHVFASWLPYLTEAGLSKKQLVVDYAPPSPMPVRQCAQRLAAQNVDLVVVECLGYKEDLRKVIFEEIKKPIILVRTVVAHAVKELTDSLR